MLGGAYRETGQHSSYDQSPAVWKAGLVVNPADFCFRDSDGYDKSIAGFTWTTDLATTLAALKPLCRGISTARRVATQLADGGLSDGLLLVTGEFVFPCAALGSAAAPGNYVTVAQGGGNTLNPQAVAVTATQGQAIGKVTRDAPVGQQFLYFKLMLATVLPGTGA